MASTHPGAPAELRAFFRWRGDSYAHYHAKRLHDVVYHAVDKADFARANEFAQMCGLKLAQKDERWTAWAQVHNVAVVLFVHAPRDLAADLLQEPAVPRDLAADLLQEPAVEVSP